MKGELTTSELVRVTEIPRRTIYRWIDQGLLPKTTHVEGRGPGQSNLYDKAVAVWAMVLDEALKLGINFTGDNRAQVYLFRPDTDPAHEGPLLLGDSVRILDYLREWDLDLTCTALSGKFGFFDKPSRDRFVEFRIIPTPVAASLVATLIDPYHTGAGYFLTGLDAHRIVKSAIIISVSRFSRHYDYAAKKLLG